MTRAAGRILVLLLAGTTACTPVDDEPPVGQDSPDPTPAPPSGDPGDWPGSAAACGLEATYESAYFLEGSFVDFDVHCTGDLGDEDALLSALRLPPGASFDEDSQRVTWSTEDDWLPELVP